MCCAAKIEVVCIRQGKEPRTKLVDVGASKRVDSSESGKVDMLLLSVFDHPQRHVMCPYIM